jgi:hypothetical protein
VQLAAAEPEQHLDVEEQLQLKGPIRTVEVFTAENLLDHGEVQQQVPETKRLLGQPDAVDDRRRDGNGRPIGRIQS